MTTIHVSFAVVETVRSLLLKKFLEISRLVSTTTVTLAPVGRQPFVREHVEHALSVATLTMTKNTIAAKTTDPDEASAPTADVSNHFFDAVSFETNKE
jgi:predicted Zn-dependent peptidase